MQVAAGNASKGDSEIPAAAGFIEITRTISNLHRAIQAEPSNPFIIVGGISLAA